MDGDTPWDAEGCSFLGGKLQFSGEFENAKCKMQNAKLMKPFAIAKAHFMVSIL